MWIFAIFPIVLFFLGAVLVTGLPVALSLQNYFRNRGLKAVVCPDSGQTVEVEVDRKYAFWTALRGQEHSRLQSCSNWPEKAECGQECLQQVEPSPENVERLMLRWYPGKTCAICARAIAPPDWRRSRLGLLNQEHKLVELRDLRFEALQSALATMQPLCWACHQEERSRQVSHARILKGDRHGLASAVID